MIAPMPAEESPTVYGMDGTAALRKLIRETLLENESRPSSVVRIPSRIRSICIDSVVYTFGDTHEAWLVRGSGKGRSYDKTRVYVAEAVDSRGVSYQLKILLRKNREDVFELDHRYPLVPKTSLGSRPTSTSFMP